MRPYVLFPALLLAAACGRGTPEPANDAAPAAANAQAPAQPATAEAALAGIPNVEVQYYDVSGDSLFAIRRALNQVRPRDPNDGLGVDALSSWYIAWTWPSAANGGCDLTRAEIRFSGRIRMPRLRETAATPEAVRMRWRAYTAVLARHEANHIRRAWEKRNLVLDAIRASSCTNADRDAMAAIGVIGRGDIDYDRTTRHGMTEGAHFP